MTEQFVITISHQLGCGGSYVGKKLSEMLSIPFVDRQILKKVADQLNIPEKALENREEKMSSFWETFLRAQALGAPIPVPLEEYMPSDEELYNLEMKYIEEVAQKGSCIILGRGGRHILRDHPRRFSLLVHGEMEERIKRVRELFKVNQEEAQDMIEKNDKDRSAYIKRFTRSDLLEAKLYDLCLNTSSIGFDKSVKIIKHALDAKFGNG